MFLQKNGPRLENFLFNLQRQRGATSIEYALLSTLIATVILVSVGNTGSALATLWSNVATQVVAALQ